MRKILRFCGYVLVRLFCARRKLLSWRGGLITGFIPAHFQYGFVWWPDWSPIISFCIFTRRPSSSANKDFTVSCCFFLPELIRWKLLIFKRFVRVSSFEKRYIRTWLICIWSSGNIGADERKSNKKKANQTLDLKENSKNEKSVNFQVKIASLLWNKIIIICRECLGEGFLWRNYQWQRH